MIKNEMASLIHLSFLGWAASSAWKNEEATQQCTNLPIMIAFIWIHFHMNASGLMCISVGSCSDGSARSTATCRTKGWMWTNCGTTLTMPSSRQSSPPTPSSSTTTAPASPTMWRAVPALRSWGLTSCLTGAWGLTSLRWVSLAPSGELRE